MYADGGFTGMARQEHLSSTIDAGSEAFRFDAFQVDAASSVDGDVHFGCLQDIGCDGTDAVDFQGLLMNGA